MPAIILRVVMIALLVPFARLPAPLAIAVNGAAGAGVGYVSTVERAGP